MRAHPLMRADAARAGCPALCAVPCTPSACRVLRAVSCVLCPVRRVLCPARRGRRLLGGRRRVARGGRHRALVRGCAQPPRGEDLRARGPLPQRPLGVPRVLQGDFQPQPAVRVGLLGEDGRRAARQILPPRRVHPYQHGDLLAAGPEPPAAVTPGLVRIDPFRPARRFGELLGRADPGQPVGAVRAGPYGRQVRKPGRVKPPCRRRTSGAPRDCRSASASTPTPRPSRTAPGYSPGTASSSTAKGSRKPAPPKGSSSAHSAGATPSSARRRRQDNAPEALRGTPS